MVGFLGSLMLSSPNTWTAFALPGKANVTNGLVATKRGYKVYWL